jgi:hypothetical protein
VKPAAGKLAPDLRSVAPLDSADGFARWKGGACKVLFEGGFSV